MSEDGASELPFRGKVQKFTGKLQNPSHPAFMPETLMCLPKEAAGFL